MTTKMPKRVINEFDSLPKNARVTSLGNNKFKIVYPSSSSKTVNEWCNSTPSFKRVSVPTTKARRITPKTKSVLESRGGRLRQTRYSSNAVNEGRVIDVMKGVGSKIKSAINAVYTSFKGIFIPTFGGQTLNCPSMLTLGTLNNKGLLPDGILINVSNQTSQMASKLGAVIKSTSAEDIQRIMLDQYYGSSSTPSSIQESVKFLDRYISSKKSLMRTKNGKRIFEGIGDSYVAVGSMMRSEDPNIPDITGEDLVWNIKMSINNKSINWMVWGAPGIGKTAIVTAFARDKNMGIVTVNCSAVNTDDVFAVSKTKVNQITNTKDHKRRMVDQGYMDGEKETPEFQPTNLLPLYQLTGKADIDKLQDVIMNGGEIDKDGNVVSEGNGGILFLDEITRADPQFQNALLSLIGDRKFQGCQMGSKWVIVAAGNRAMDEASGGGIGDVSTALMNRFNQVNYIPEHKAWIEWAETSGNFAPEIIDYLTFNPDRIHTMHEAEEVGDSSGVKSTLFASHRSWEKAAIAYKASLTEFEKMGMSSKDPKVKQRLRKDVNSAIGSKDAGQFFEFLAILERLSQADIKNILNGNYEDVVERVKGAQLVELTAIALVLFRSIEGVFTQNKEDFENEEVVNSLYNFLSFFVVEISNPSMNGVIGNMIKNRQLRRLIGGKYKHNQDKIASGQSLTPIEQKQDDILVMLDGQKPKRAKSKYKAPKKGEDDE